MDHQHVLVSHLATLSYLIVVSLFLVNLNNFSVNSLVNLSLENCISLSLEFNIAVGNGLAAYTKSRTID